MSAEVSFHILGSSSAGNCALLTTPGCRVLIDMGFPARKLGDLLKPLKLGLKDVDAVFITHEHGDHTCGLAALLRHPHVQVFANRETARTAQTRLRFRPAWQFFETGTTFIFRDLEVSSFSIPHDASDPVGFVFSIAGATQGKSPRRIAWCTDLGYVPELVRERIRSVDVLVLESNYDPDMLDRDHRRPWALKQRIKSRHGHLSNYAAHELLRTTENASWRRVYLAHLSRECNDVQLVRETFATLGQNGHRYAIEVVDPAAEAMITCEFGTL
jgi:phosphoribosyl 1,2-cyclic phosphodiesterase